MKTQDFRMELREREGTSRTRRFEPLRLGEILVSIQPSHWSASGAAREHIDTWEVIVTAVEPARTLGPSNMPQLFPYPAVAAHWRRRALNSTTRIHVGEDVPTAVVQHLLDFIRQHTVQLGAGIPSDEWLSMVERQESEQEAMEGEWEVDGRYGWPTNIYRYGE